MKLLIHLGTEKTGSSYLQTLCAVNRRQLAEHGIWFPHAGKRESDLVKGNASPGNASLLNAKLQNQDFQGAREWLLSRLTESKRNNCHTLLLSNEILSLTLAKEEVFSFFDNLVKDLGFKFISYLLYIREPVDFALSLYKHRAKNGKVDEIEYWMDSNFYYNLSLESFLSLSKKRTANLVIKKYASEEGFMEKSFFFEWLGIDQEFERPKSRVNPSLSLSELAIIRRLAKSSDLYPQVFYRSFLAVERSSKAGEKLLENHYRYVIQQKLLKYRKTWDMLNSELSKKDQLKSLDEEIVDEERCGEFQFSSYQLEAIASAIALSSKMKTKLTFAFHGFKNRFLSWLKRKIS